MDIGKGLFTSVLRDAADYDHPALETTLQQLKVNIKERNIQAQQMRDYVITLSNFGMIAGCYATTVVDPPAAAILGTPPQAEPPGNQAKLQGSITLRILPLIHFLLS